MEKNAKVYVAGHSGLVGSALTRKLRDSGYTNIIMRSHKDLDLTRQSEVEAFFKKERPSHVFLAAAKVGGILANNTYKAEFIYQNLMIAANVINASYKFDVKKLLNLGSSCIYPKYASQPMKEEYLLTGNLEPTNEPYSIAKITAIKLCRYFNEQYGTNFISVMPTNLYGPNDNFDLETSHVLPALMRKMHLGKCLQNADFKSIKSDIQKRLIRDHDANKMTHEDIVNLLSKFGIKSNCSENSKILNSEFQIPTITKIWGTGSPYREFLHVDDLADACVFLTQNYHAKEISEFVNIGSGVELQIKELTEIIKEAVGYRGEIAWDTSKPDGMPRKLLDISRIKSLGWQPTINLEEGIRKVYKWYLEN